MPAHPWPQRRPAPGAVSLRLLLCVSSAYLHRVLSVDSGEFEAAASPAPTHYAPRCSRMEGEGSLGALQDLAYAGPAPCRATRLGRRMPPQLSLYLNNL